MEESRLNESFLREWDDKEINAVSTQVDVLAEIFNKYEAEEQQNENASEITMDQFERTAKEEEFIASMKTKEKEAKTEELPNS